MKIETEKYKEALEKYLNEGINWNADKVDVIKCNRGNVEQLAADSFHEGCKFVMEMFGIKELK